MPSMRGEKDKSFLSKIQGNRNQKELNSLLSSSSQNDSNTFDYVNFPMPSSSSVSGSVKSTASSRSNTNDDFLHSYYNVENSKRTKSMSIAARYRNGEKLTSSTSELVFRTTSSTKRAMKELAQKRYEAKQRRKASCLFICLVALASSIYYVSNSNYNHGTLRTGGVNPSVEENMFNGTSVGNTLSNNSTETGLNQTSSEDGTQITKEIQEDNEPPPEEEEIEEGNEFLQPLKYFADLTTQSRPTDSNFFFHIPRSGGQTIKDIVGKCLKMTLASEVGVRDGHSEDTALQSIDYNGAKYVNVDTTSIEGLHRAAALNLASSGLSDMITSSYFGEVGMLFDLHHKGRAFVLLRDPTVRAVSMYYYKTQGDAPMIDPSVSLEEYAQGNGIENNWVTRFLTGRMEGELMKEDLEHAKLIIEKKFLIGFLDDGEETIYRLMKYFGFSFSDDETVKMEQEDCIKDLLKEGTNQNTVTYDIPKRGSQAAALIKWQTQFDIKLFDYARELFDAQTKFYGSKERKKALRKKKKEGH